MTPQLTGIHHVTAIASDPQKNVDFYAGTLGLRLVKQTVNFDDPGSYHLYYGDGAGHPGTLLTFFAWPHGRHGRPGLGQVAAATFSVGPDSFPFWRERLQSRGVSVEDVPARFGESVLAFDDPDGMRVELVGASGDERTGWSDGPVPAAHAIRGIHAATLPERDPAQTVLLLTDTLNLRFVATEGDWTRYAFGAGRPGAFADVHMSPDEGPGQIAVGSIHHVAWRTPDDAQQGEWLQTIAGQGYGISPVMDREYFHSVYFREPGGILFEIATDPPGFTTDEALETLGHSLQLPPMYESQRTQIVSRLPPLRVPG